MESFAKIFNGSSSTFWQRAISATGDSFNSLLAEKLIKDEMKKFSV